MHYRRKNEAQRTRARNFLLTKTLPKLVICNLLTITVRRLFQCHHRNAGRCLINIGPYSFFYFERTFFIKEIDNADCSESDPCSLSFRCYLLIHFYFFIGLQPYLERLTLHYCRERAWRLVRKVSAEYISGNTCTPKLLHLKAVR